MSNSSTPRTRRQSATELGGPGSLVHSQARTRGRCRHCGSEHVTVITMTLTDGTPVNFESCHRCERRSWAHQGAALSFDHVIEKTRKIA